MAKDKHRHERERQGRRSTGGRTAMGAAATAAELETEDKAEETAETAKADSGAETVGDERSNAAQAEIETLNDRLKWTLAEFENLRKRSECEKTQMFDLGVRSVLEKFLPVIDDFEHNVAQVPESEDSDIEAYAEGMDMMYRQLLKNLRGAGVEATDAKDRPFNPAYHNTVTYGDSEVLGENIVSEESQKDYLYKDSVLRHSMVKVAN